MNPVEALRASGLNPIVIDEDTDLDSALSAAVVITVGVYDLLKERKRRDEEPRRRLR